LVEVGDPDRELYRHGRRPYRGRSSAALVCGRPQQAD
jgi:hypothetical protein